MNETSIAWTDYSSNPLRYRDAAGKTVWACVHASPGCQHCYAESTAKRFHHGADFTMPNMRGLTPYLDEKELHTLLTSRKLAGKRVFVSDMTDLFGDWVTDDLLDVLFAHLSMRADVTWQVLTKRAARLYTYVYDPETPKRVWLIAFPDLWLQSINPGPGRDVLWPPDNIWFGVSVEDQRRADERVWQLCKTPAAVRFLSCEPLLGPIDFSGLTVGLPWAGGSAQGGRDYTRCLPMLDWVIVGGESGPGARPCDVYWVRNIVEQCQAAGVACFTKQLGSNASVDYYFPGDDDLRDWAIDQGAVRETVDGSVWRMENGQPPSGSRFRVPLAHKGGDWDCWPEDLRVRQLPE